MAEVTYDSHNDFQFGYDDLKKILSNRSLHHTESEDLCEMLLIEHSPILRLFIN